MSVRVMRTVGAITSAATLSLFATIAAYTVVQASTLKWDRSFCNAACVASMDARLTASPKVMVASTAQKPRS